MSVSLDNLEIVKKYDNIYETSNETHVLGKDFEKVLATPNYKILGFANNYMYCNSNGYLVKNTLEGVEVSRVFLECDHAAFNKELDYFYTWSGKTITKIDSNLITDWSLTFEDKVSSIAVDIYGSFYVTFEVNRTIRKIDKNGNDIMFITDSDDVTKKCRIYKVISTPGGRFIYVIGSQFYGYNDAADSFIDMYDMQKGIRLSRQMIAHGTGVPAYDSLYEFDNLVVHGDYYYIFAKEYIKKLNLRGIEIWKYVVGYNPVTQKFDQIGHIEFDDSDYDEYLYFCEDLYSSNGHSFGKMQTDGKVLWKLTLAESVQNADFKMCVYQDRIYTSDKVYIQDKSPALLALDDNRLLFKTENGHLVRVLEYNKEIYASQNYEGYQLLGRKIKDDVHETIYSSLMHDSGNLVTEDGYAIIMEMDNPDYLNDSNYDYFKLLHSEYTSNETKASIITTADGKVIGTKLGSIIQTQVPYSGELVNDYIVSQSGDAIMATDTEAIIRSRSYYSKIKNLLCDWNMFNDYIITQSDASKIATLRDGYYLLRKCRQVYRYILSKYRDIDIIAEWLIQNDILASTLPDYVDKLRHHTTSLIQEVQVAGVPVIYDIQATKVFEYTYNARTQPIQTYGTQIFVCNNLPFNKRSETPDGTYIDSIANLVDEKKIRPFLLFLNGRAIRWTDCVIVKDWSYTYVVIQNTDVNETNLECIMFPCHIRYGEDNDIYDPSLNIEHMYFDENGLLTEDIDKVAFRVETIDRNINGDTQYDSEKIIVPAGADKLASEKNIIVFENGRLFGDSRFYLTNYGKNIFKYDICNRDIESVTFKTFYYMRSNKYLGLLWKVPNQEEIVSEIESRVDGNIVSSIPADSFMEPFNFKLYRSKPYDQNIANAVSYIMKYDMSLLLQYYRNRSNIKSFLLSGEDVIKRAVDDGGYIRLPRSRKNNSDDFVIVFVNNDLYEYNYEIKYLGREFRIPVFDHIFRDSTVEVLHFCNVNNSSYTLTITEGEDDYIPEQLRYGNFNLFGNSVSGSAVYANTVNYEETGILYNLGFSYKNNYDENGKYKSTSFILDDPYYYGKPITIASKRQFHYMYYTYREGQSVINLAPWFRFCHNKNQYMVFINKKKVNFSDFDLHIVDYESDRKWNYITCNIDISVGDVIEVYYLPDPYEEIVVPNTGSKGYGDIYMDIEDLDCQFDKDLFLIFKDGQKINYSAIENVAANRVRIKNETGILNNITVMKMLQPDVLLSELVSYGDSWSKAIDSLSPVDFEKLLMHITIK